MKYGGSVAFKRDLIFCCLIFSHHSAGALIDLCSCAPNKKDVFYLLQIFMDAGARAKMLKF